jgi:hypothetical protein
MDWEIVMTMVVFQEDGRENIRRVESADCGISAMNKEKRPRWGSEPVVVPSLLLFSPLLMSTEDTWLVILSFLLRKEGSKEVNWKTRG